MSNFLFYLNQFLTEKVPHKLGWMSSKSLGICCLYPFPGPGVQMHTTILSKLRMHGRGKANSLAVIPPLSTLELLFFPRCNLNFRYKICLSSLYAWKNNAFTQVAYGHEQIYPSTQPPLLSLAPCPCHFSPSILRFSSICSSRSLSFQHLGMKTFNHAFRVAPYVAFATMKDLISLWLMPP